MKIVADENIPFVKECFSAIGEVTTVGGRAITRQVVADADVLLVRSITQVNEALLKNSSVRFVATATIGMEHVDQDYLASAGIGFASAPGCNANSVAEYIVAALLALGRKHKIELAGRRIGIVGVGNVGGKVEKKTAALGMRPVLNDPPLARQTGDPKYQPLEAVYDCDFVTMHTPLTREGLDKTHHLADDAFFNALREGCFFINTSRGSVVDTPALKRALLSGRLGGAVLDVWENEPNIDGELILKADLSTPHIAGYSFDGKVLGLIMVYRAVCEHFGIGVQHEAADFLPEPPVPLIRIDAPVEDQQAAIHDAVQQVYVINRDDFNTREILLVAPDQRGKFFDDLRKHYPTRREFQNTGVQGVDADDALGRKLAGIGFNIA
ncbi:MAG: 4-phosphoerythronate dehydrogenase [Phycisphaerae bacterium]|nr:4-phosphoerythronate dehydrogenase [Phycisphaerae bacterium]